MDLKLTLAALIVLGSGSAATAQSAFDNVDIASERNEDLREDIEEDFERDVDDFGNEGRPRGFSGSVALRATAASGNSDTGDVGIGAEFGYFDGTNGYSLELNYDYSEVGGSKTEESLFYDAEYRRDLSPRLYAFGKLQGTIDEFSAYKSDTFLGFGAGYRIFDRPEIQWTVQGGPGWRVADLDAIADGDLDEGAVAISSGFLNRLTETVYVTNDTDIVASESDTVVLNDLALTVSMTDRLALRTSVQTEYHTDPQPGFRSTDNNYGISLVYSF